MCACSGSESGRAGTVCATSTLIPSSGLLDLRRSPENLHIFSSRVSIFFFVLAENLWARQKVKDNISWLSRGSKRLHRLNVCLTLVEP